MPFSDEQFTKLWELVIRIDENTKNQYKTLEDHAQSDIAQFAITNQAVSSVHSRLDRVKVDLEAEQKSEREESAKTVGFQNKLMGAILLAAFTVPIIVQIVTQSFSHK